MLTPIQINAAIIRAKRDQQPQTLKMDSGLFLRITAKGSALWCGKTKFAGKTYNRSFGHYPEVTPSEARLKKNDWAATVRADENDAGDNYTLRQAYEEWAERKRLTTASFHQISNRIKRHILSPLGGRKMKDLTAYTFIKAWRPLEEEGKITTLQTLSGYVRQIAIFVQNTGRVEELHDLTHIGANYVRNKPIEHRVALSPQQLTDMFYELEGNPCPHGMPWLVFLGILYTLSRSSEVCRMEWDWIDFENKVIHFPVEIMKKRRPHDVPMSTQLEALLKGLPRVNKYVFISRNSSQGNPRPVSRGSVATLLREHGLQGRQCPHGVRSIGAQWMAENGVPEDVAEACLAHASGSAVRRAYQRSELLEQRRPVMQAWCDYVEQCRLQALERMRTEKEK